MELVLFPDPRLSRVAREIDQIDDKIRERARAMIEIMHESKGVGLAANQVGWLRRLIVINPSCEKGKETVLINPVIESRKGFQVGEEGCLSFPGVYGEVERSAEVRVRAVGLDGEECCIEGDGLTATVLQHEIDHIDGLLFISKMTPADRARNKKRLQELNEEYEDTHE